MFGNAKKMVRRRLCKLEALITHKGGSGLGQREEKLLCFGFASHCLDFSERRIPM